jgi:hypothetical protein
MRPFVAGSIALLATTSAFAQTQAPAPSPSVGTAPAPTPSPPPVYGPPAYGPPAYGPPAYGPPAYGPPIYGNYPQAPNPTAHRHDGFYLRLGLGSGYGHVGSSGTLSMPSGSGLSGQPMDFTGTYHGWGPAYELLIGGTIARGLVLGGGFVGQDMTNPTVTANVGSGSAASSISNLTVNGSLGVGALGPFVDWFPNDRGGLHFGAMFGFALLGLSSDTGKRDSGIAGSLWGGYDFWVADQWSLGVEARTALVSAWRDFSDPRGTVNDKAVSVELLFTALYH